jgi:hypothetical protein
MASGTIYRRTTAAGSAAWVVHKTWNEGACRRQSKRSFRTKQEAKDELTRFLGAHQTGAFVAPSRMTLAEFVDPWIDGLANQGRRPSTLALPPRSRPVRLAPARQHGAAGHQGHGHRLALRSPVA